AKLFQIDPRIESHAQRRPCWQRSEARKIEIYRSTTVARPGSNRLDLSAPVARAFLFAYCLPDHIEQIEKCAVGIKIRSAHHDLRRRHDSSIKRKFARPELFAAEIPTIHIDQTEVEQEWRLNFEFG